MSLFAGIDEQTKKQGPSVVWTPLWSLSQARVTTLAVDNDSQTGLACCFILTQNSKIRESAGTGPLVLMAESGQGSMIRGSTCSNLWDFPIKQEEEKCVAKCYLS